MTQCRSRPDCPCDFCTDLRIRHTSGLSEKEVEDLLALCWIREREMDAELRAKGWKMPEGWELAFEWGEY
jgi:hypothetical protein